MKKTTLKEPRGKSLYYSQHDFIVSFVMFDDTAGKFSSVVYILNQTNLFLWYFFIRKFYHSDTITAKGPTISNG